MLEYKYNFQRIRDAVEAAHHAQSAGYDDKCKEILQQLANELQDNEVNHDQ